MALPVIILVLTAMTCVIALTACGVDGISKESDLYGDYFTEDSSRCLTLSEDNNAVLGIGPDVTETYYAKYDLAGAKIELREGGNRGALKYTLKIEDADTLVVEIEDYTVDGEGNPVVNKDDSGNPIMLRTVFHRA